MASTLEMWVSTLALLVNSFVILVMAFLGNLILPPIINNLEKFVVGPQPIPMTNMQHIVGVIWTILVIMEIVCILAFLITIARRNTMETYYDY